MDRVEILKLTATGLAGLFAGGAIYINLCEAPARATLDVAPRNKQWGESFKRAKRWQVCIQKSTGRVVPLHACSIW